MKFGLLTIDKLYLDSEWVVSIDGILTLWIINEHGEEFGWINKIHGMITNINFLRRNLKPEEVINDTEIQKICPDLVNMMIIYLVHQG